MLQIAEAYSELDLSAVDRIYGEFLIESARENYPDAGKDYGIALAREDFHSYLRDFFRDGEKAFYAFWVVDGVCVSALRMEGYRDGLLIEALETQPDMRCKGYASLLLRAAAAYADEKYHLPIYAHVGKKNNASLAVHRKCGFETILDHAEYIDGTVTQRAVTVCKKKSL